MLIRFYGFQRSVNQSWQRRAFCCSCHSSLTCECRLQSQCFTVAKSQTGQIWHFCVQVSYISLIGNLAPVCLVVSTEAVFKDPNIVLISMYGKVQWNNHDKVEHFSVPVVGEAQLSLCNLCAQFWGEDFLCCMSCTIPECLVPYKYIPRLAWVYVHNQTCMSVYLCLNLHQCCLILLSVVPRTTAIVRCWLPIYLTVVKLIQFM